MLNRVDHFLLIPMIVYMYSYENCDLLLTLRFARVHVSGLIHGIIWYFVKKDGKIRSPSP